ncbi:hypothetical protein AB9M75_11800 [Lactobacillus sp. AN1001]
MFNLRKFRKQKENKKYWKVYLVEREHKGVYMNFIVKAPNAVEADRLIESYLNGKIDPNKEIDIWIG